MKRRLLLSLLAVMVTGLGTLVRAEDDFEPLAATLRDRAVVMDLPAGVRRVRLRIRQADGTWLPCTMAHLAGVERYLKLRLPDGVTEADLELAASYTDPFPYSYYQGQSSFGTTAAGDGSAVGPMAPAGFGDGATGPTEETTVEESDIWKWRGSTLYFFNQYRGLQVMDVSDPAAPERLATHPLPSNGEQMYLHPSADLVILLTHGQNTGNGEVVLLRHESRHELVEQECLPVPGYILESRMVGEVLYVVSRHSFEEHFVDPDTGLEHVTWRSGLAVTKIDLSDPDKAVVDPALELTSEQFNYWGAQVQATPQALLVSTNAYDAVRRQSVSTVHVVDISKPAAAPAVTHQLPVAGQVRNKFNMQLKGTILTVVSQVWRGGTARETYASVETFDLADASAAGAGPLGHLEFAQNESITATRFVGDLLYVVTFLQIDPLFVVELSDPADPRLLGELEVPGFSTHLEPYGSDALISIGVEGSQIAVSWFDVSDPTDASLADRVYVGAPDGWSWTEANWDEKAFGFFPDEGLILLPYQGSDPDRGWITGVQVIELGNKQLIKRGSFEHEFRARRARVLGSAMASISGRALRTLDLSDPDNPQILADLTLAWPADLVHRLGDWLVQLEGGGGSWYQPTASVPPARLHVSPAGDPEELTTSLDLGPGRVVGSLVVGDCLWVAQTQMTVTTVADRSSHTEVFAVTAVDLSDPEHPVIAGRDERLETTADYPYYYSGSNLVGALLPDGALVWYPGEQDQYFYLDSFGGGPMADGFMPWFPQPGEVYTVDIVDKTNPRVLAVVDLRATDQHWPEGKLRLVGAVLYHGFQETISAPLPDGTVNWQSQHWLGQIDLSDPAAPVKRDPVKLPGTFEHALGTPGGGVVLFSSRTDSFEIQGVWRSEYRVQGLAFDGVKAYLLDELVVPDKGYGPSAFDGASIILGRTDYGTNTAHAELTIYQWLASGGFHELQTLRRPGAVYRIGVSDRVLVTTGSNSLSFIDFIDPGDPDPAVVTAPSRTFWQGIELIEIYQRETAYVPQGLWGVAAIDFGGMFAEASAALAEGEEPVPGSDWETIPLAVLPATPADSDLLLGALAAGDDWLVTGAAVPVGYEDWMRRVLGLSASAPVPAAALDSDFDGLSNGWEYHSGSDPGDPASGVRPRPFLDGEAGGEQFLSVRVFVNPHASGDLQPEFSHNAIDWYPDPDGVDFVADAFSPSVVVRIPVPIQGPDVTFFRFSFD